MQQFDLAVQQRRIKTMLTENAGKHVDQKETEVKEKVSKKKEKELEKQVNEFPTDDMIDGDIDLSETRKKRFRINGDNSKILEINVADMNTIVRLQEDYPKLMDLAHKVIAIRENEDSEEVAEDELNRMADAIKSIDKEMRNLVDHIFNTNVSEVCAADGSMYDLFNGVFRFEHIIDKIGALYSNNLSNEIKAISARVQKHTSKYTGK